MTEIADNYLCHTDLMDLTDLSFDEQRNGSGNSKSRRWRRKRRLLLVSQNRGSSESSVNLFRHCRVVTEEDDSQRAERAERAEMVVAGENGEAGILANALYLHYLP